MARYRKLIVQGKSGWYLMNPCNPWEALRIAWNLWRHPDRAGVLVSVGQEFIREKCTPESTKNTEEVL